MNQLSCTGNHPLYNRDNTTKSNSVESSIETSIETSADNNVNWLVEMYRCQTCLPLLRYRHNTSHIPPPKPLHRNQRYCCVYAALSEALPVQFPIDVVSLTYSYALTSISYDFLTTPLPRELGMMQCNLVTKGTTTEAYIVNPKRYSAIAAVNDTTMEVEKKQQQEEEQGKKVTREDSKTLPQDSKSLLQEEPQQVGPVSKRIKTSLPEHYKSNTNVLLSRAAAIENGDADDWLFLLAATRKRRWTGTDYDICTDCDNQSNDSFNHEPFPVPNRAFQISRLSSNFGGSQFVCQQVKNSYGKNKQHQEEEEQTSATGVIQYRHFLDETTGAPIQLKVMLPNRSFFEKFSAVCAAGRGAHNNKNGHCNNRTNSTNVISTVFQAAAKMIGGRGGSSSSNISSSISSDIHNSASASAATMSAEAILSQFQQENEDWCKKNATSTSEAKSHYNDENVFLNRLSLLPVARPNLEIIHSLTSINTKNNDNNNDDNDNDNNDNLESGDSPINRFPTTTLANREIEYFENLCPVWSDGLNAYTLEFENKRVEEASVKNFKLVQMSDPRKRTVMQFGRTANRKVFIMDFAHPLTPLQAFEIALSSIDNKLGI